MKKTNLLSTLLNGQKITYVDVGAADNIDLRWSVFAKMLNYVGFEPDKRSEVIEPNEKYGSKKIIRNALWNSKGKIILNLARKPQLSSYYLPNSDFTNLFSDFNRFDIVDKINLDTIRLDDVKIENCDFIKLDIQGGELKVLEGSINKLEKCFGIEVEVEFSSIYLDQPLFPDVVDYLKKKNLIFIDFINLTRWERDNSYSGIGQCTFADALFLKSPETIINSKNLNLKVLSRYLAILFIYQRFDLIQVISENIDKENYKSLSSFFQELKLIRNKQKYSIKLNRLFNKILKTIFGTNYKSHLTY